MSTYRTGKYDYNAICDVCGFKKKASELRQRWDGFMVCEEDWEPRNILDFYRTRQDAHLLPFTRPEDSSENSWIPTIYGGSFLGGITAPLNTLVKTGTYIYDTSTGKFHYNIQIKTDPLNQILDIDDATQINISINPSVLTGKTSITDLGAFIMGATTGLKLAIGTGNYYNSTTVNDIVPGIYVKGDFLARFTVNGGTCKETILINGQFTVN